ncbi:HYR domain-containing protein [Oceanihabitans sp.]|nr:HYR domain-containing protein [Oceanihabitans sp.]
MKTNSFSKSFLNEAITKKFKPIHGALFKGLCLSLLLLFTLNVSAQNWTEIINASASDAAANDQFGYSVAISGDTAIVGARLNDDAGSNSGSAYVFVRSGTTWIEQAKLTASDAAADDRFGLSVAILGDTAIVGAISNDDAGSNSGSAYFFEQATATDADNDGFADDVDCDDSNADVYPGAPELCDGLDNNCIDGIDEGVQNTYYADTDGDGYGNPNDSVEACSAPSGFVANNTDCNDNDATINPGAIEIFDGIDNNCNGLIDCDDPGYIDTEAPTIACAAPVNINNTPGHCYGEVVLTPPTVSDNCSGTGNALAFDGVNDYVSFGNLGTVNDWSVEGWFYSTEWVNYRNLFHSDFQNNNSGLRIEQWSTGVLKIYVAYPNGDYNATSVEIENQWFHLAVVADKTNSRCKVYVDGVLVVNAAQTGWPANFPNFGVGGGHSSTRYFKGYIDEFRIWNIARTQTEIQNNLNNELSTETGLIAAYHFNEGIADGNNAGVITTADASGNGNDGTLNNFALTGTTSNWVEGNVLATPIVTNDAPATFAIGDTTVTWTATDAAGNTAMCEQIVTVTDNELPVINDTPANIIVDNNSGSCDAAVTWTAATVSDNCPNATISSDYQSGDIFPVGTTTVTYTASDANGNDAAAMSFTVTVNDTEAPTIVCAANQTQTADPGLCTADIIITPPTFSDNCATSGSTSSAPPVTNGLLYFYDFSGNANDVWGGNNGTVSGPTLTSNSCDDPNSAYNFAGTGTGQRVSLGNEGTFAYPTGSFALSAWVKGDDFAGGTNTILDINISASSVVARNSGIRLEVSSAGVPRIIYRQVGELTSAFSRVNGSSSIPLGEWHHITAVRDAVNGISYMYVDGVQVGSSVTANNAIDYDAETYDDNSVNIGWWIRAGRPGTAEFNGSIDQVGIFNTALTPTEVATLSANPCPPTVLTNNYTNTDNASGVYPIGDTTVTWTATDAAGNTATCTQVITVTDNEDPEITCPSNIDVFATSASGAVATYTAPTGTDNCPNAATTLITPLFLSGATFPIGVTTVTYEVTDAASNTAECSFTVTVTGLAPDIECPANITVNNDAGACGAVVSFVATDAIGIPASTITYDIQPGSFFDVGTTIVTATATNAVGTDSCTFTITVNDTEAPGGDSIQFSAPALALSNIPEAANYNLVYELNIPNGVNWDANSQVSYAVNNAAALTNIPFTRVAYMMELDNKWVWVSFDEITQDYNQIGIPADYVKQQAVSNMNVFASTNAGVTTGTDIQTGNVEFWSDCYVQGAGNGSIPTGSNSLYDFNDISDGRNDCYGSFQVHNYAISETLFAFNRWSTNGNNDLGIGNQVGGSGHPDWTFAGNAANYTTKKIYVLALSSSVVCNAVTLTLDASGQATLNLAQVNTGVTDNCGVATSVLSQTSFDCSNLGENTVTLTITDIHGNISTCSSTVTVEDNIAPVITCVSNDIRNTDSGLCTYTIVATEFDATFTDNCDDGSITNSLNGTATIAGEVLQKGANTITWTVDDGNGQSAICTTIITVEDN